MATKDIMMKSNAALDRAISECTDASKIAEIIKGHLESTGMIANERGDGWGIRLARPLPTDMVQQPPRPFFNFAPKPTDTEYRVCYPGGNQRIEITGASVEELDLKEQQLKTMFGAQQ